jgi:hypothetical protein
LGRIDGILVSFQGVLTPVQSLLLAPDDRRLGKLTAGQHRPVLNGDLFVVETGLLAIVYGLIPVGDSLFEINDLLFPVGFVLHARRDTFCLGHHIAPLPGFDF